MNKVLSIAVAASLFAGVAQAQSYRIMIAAPGVKAATDTSGPVEPGPESVWEEYRAANGLTAADAGWSGLNWRLSGLTTSADSSRVTDLPTSPYPNAAPSGSIYLDRNQLTNVDGLASLTSVGGFLLLYSNQLTNVDGLSSLASVGTYLYLYGNQLTNVDGLASLTSVGNDILLYQNPDLTDISGLANVNVGGGIRFDSRNDYQKLPHNSDFCTLNAAGQFYTAGGYASKSQICEGY